MKIQKISFLCLLLIFIGTPAAFAQHSGDTLTGVEKYGHLRVKGTHLADSAGNPVQLQGMSMFWSNWTNFYTYGAVEEIQKFWCANTVRAAMGVSPGGAYLDDSTGEINKVITVVEAAIDLGMYVVIDWHSHSAHTEEAEAVKFFRFMAKKYGDTPNVIYEPYNEPVNADWSNDIKPYLKTVIDTIRNYDPDNVIICGTPSYSSDLSTVRFDSIQNRNNIMYAYHYYAGTHGNGARNDVSNGIQNGLPLFVSEYGNVKASGDGALAKASAREWWDLLDKHHISHLNWSLHDKDEGASAVVPGASPNGGWGDSLLTESGKFVKNHLLNNCPDYRPKVTNIENSDVSSQEITVYPNPASDKVILKDFNRTRNKQWQLYNTFGQKVKKGTKATINVSGLKPGVYILKTGTNTHRILVR